MTLQETMKYRDQMRQMILRSQDDPELLSHYQDEYKRVSKIVSEAWHLSIEQMANKILEKRNGY
ncbi:MAG: hypothetical protein ACRCXK_13345 [Wohlfahrtiimonas sp.]